MLLTGDGVDQDCNLAVEYLKKAIDKGYTISMVLLGDALQNGYGIDCDKKEACRYYKMAADQGNKDGMFNYAKALENGDGINPNPREACKYFKMAADLGDVQSMRIYAGKLFYGIGVQADPKESEKYLDMVVDRGDKMAEALLSIYFDRKNCDEELKRYYLKYFAEMGDIYAIIQYSNLLITQGGMQNLLMALRCLQNGIFKGNLICKMLFSHVLALLRDYKDDDNQDKDNDGQNENNTNDSNNQCGNSEDNDNEDHDCSQNLKRPVEPIKEDGIQKENVTEREHQSSTPLLQIRRSKYKSSTSRRSIISKPRLNQKSNKK